MSKAHSSFVLAACMALIASGGAHAQSLQESAIILPDIRPVSRPGSNVASSLIVVEDIEIDVPALVIVGAPELEDIVIDVPALVIVGEPELEDIVIDVPALVIVGEPKPDDIIIDVPALVIVGEPEEDEPDKEDTTEQDTAEQDDPNTDIGVEQAQTEGDPATSQDPVTGSAMLPVSDWCMGSYDAHIGRGMGTAVGFAMPFGKTMVAGAKVTPVGCRSAFSIRLQGKLLTLTPAGPARTYAGSVDFGDGAMRTLTLTCDADLNLRGALVAKDANLRIERPVWMLRKAGGSTTLENCPAEENQ